MHSKSNNKIMFGNKTDKIIQELLDSLLQNNQKGLEESINSRENKRVTKFNKLSSRY